MKDAYKDYFMIGVAVNQRNVSDQDQIKLINKEFCSITAENDMKPGMIHPKEGVWDFEKADKIANFCRQNGIKLRGHCLCWHSQFADWMFTDYAWDVVNEAISDGGGFGGGWGRPGQAPNPYRESRHYKLCGDEFIAKAFEFAHEADPNALLFYNDYNECDPGKRDRIYNMVKKMQDAGVPIHGIGMQGHYNVYGPSEEDIDAAITKYSQLVKHIHVTELDIRMNTLAI